MSEVERLLRGALVPIDPPERLSERLERRLTSITDAAVDEWADFDESALRDPRRWARLVAAGGVGAGARGAPVGGFARPKQEKSGGPGRAGRPGGRGGGAGPTRGGGGGSPRRWGAAPPAASRLGPPRARASNRHGSTRAAAIISSMAVSWAKARNASARRPR